MIDWLAHTDNVAYFKAKLLPQVRKSILVNGMALCSYRVVTFANRQLKSVFSLSLCA
jgi:hypothetical protein